MIRSAICLLVGSIIAMAAVGGTDVGLEAVDTDGDGIGISTQEENEYFHDRNRTDFPFSKFVISLIWVSTRQSENFSPPVYRCSELFRQVSKAIMPTCAFWNPIIELDERIFVIGEIPSLYVTIVQKAILLWFWVHNLHSMRFSSGITLKMSHHKFEKLHMNSHARYYEALIVSRARPISLDVKKWWWYRGFTMKHETRCFGQVILSKLSDWHQFENLTSDRMLFKKHV